MGTSLNCRKQGRVQAHGRRDQAFDLSPCHWRRGRCAPWAPLASLSCCYRRRAVLATSESPVLAKRKAPKTHKQSHYTALHDLNRVSSDTKIISTQVDNCTQTKIEQNVDSFSERGVEESSLYGGLWQNDWMITNVA